LGRARNENVIAAVAQFLPAVHNLLGELEASVASRIENRGQGAKAIQQHQEAIGQALRALSKDLGVIGGLDADVS
jgi:hypothetical protein